MSNPSDLIEHLERLGLRDRGDHRDHWPTGISLTREEFSSILATLRDEGHAIKICHLFRLCIVSNNNLLAKLCVEEGGALIRGVDVEAAIKMHNFELVEWIFKLRSCRGVFFVKETSPIFTTDLIRHAVYSRNAEMVRLLLSQDLVSVTCDGNAYITFAAISTGNVEILKILVDHGFSLPDDKSIDHEVAQGVAMAPTDHEVALHGNVAMARFLHSYCGYQFHHEACTDAVSFDKLEILKVFREEFRCRLTHSDYQYAETERMRKYLDEQSLDPDSDPEVESDCDDGELYS